MDQIFAFTSAFIIILTLLINTTLISNEHLHVQVSFHDICLLSLVLDIRLNTLLVILLTISGLNNLAYGSLILLQLPLHLLIAIL